IHPQSHTHARAVGQECSQGRFFKNLHHLDPSAPAFPHSVRHSSPRRVNHRHESHEAEIGDGEVDVIHIKLEASRKLVFGEEVMAEA
uniref:Uncharacterized protein n=1 Tax=Salvator merianae TaxID=96440 RepID=A0A8D0BV79_SALMN